jgi:hypothetical protein
MDGETWEKVILALIGGIGGFIGGLFTKLLALIFPSYNDLVKEINELKAENRQLREDKNGLEDDVNQLTERIEDLERQARGRSTLGL